MTINVKPVIAPQYATNVQATYYTATNCKMTIAAFTATNQTASNQTISVHLVPSGGTAGADNRIVKDKTILPNETYTFPELTGQTLAPSGVISLIASANSALTISASGWEIT